MIRQQKISGIWTVERSMEYLLLSGLICEAVWFADQMGNWKTAFQLASAWSLHHSIAPQVYIKYVLCMCVCVCERKRERVCVCMRAGDVYMPLCVHVLALIKISTIVELLEIDF